MKFIIESSTVPIYNRIATAFTSTLIEFGHTVHFIDPTGFSDENFIKIINGIDIDYYISTNELNKIQQKSISNDIFLFEAITANKIFIHHDNIYSGLHDLQTITKKIRAHINAAENSHHFCLEHSNAKMLNDLGIKNAYPTYHASEFNAAPNIHNLRWGISFVGHLMSSLNLYPAQSLVAGEHLRCLAWSRYSSSKFSIKPGVKKLSEDKYIFSAHNNTEPGIIESCGLQQYLISDLNKMSSAIRGELICSIKDQRIDIFGGDLSYGRIKDPLLKIEQDNIYYQPATTDYHLTQEIYQQSQISLNFTALQFDTAMNNRCIDVICSGGFLLTDAMPDWINSSELAKEIAFETPEELNYKINYYKNHLNRYQEVQEAIRDSITKTYNYKIQISQILQTVQSITQVSHDSK